MRNLLYWILFVVFFAACGESGAIAPSQQEADVVSQADVLSEDSEGEDLSCSSHADCRDKGYKFCSMSGTCVEPMEEAVPSQDVTEQEDSATQDVSESEDSGAEDTAVSDVSDDSEEEADADEADADSEEADQEADSSAGECQTDSDCPSAEVSCHDGSWIKSVWYECDDGDCEKKQELEECTHGCEDGACLSASDPCEDADCDDGNPCTMDHCVDGECSHDLVPGCCLDDDDCDDGNPCTMNRCVEGECFYPNFPDYVFPMAGCQNGGFCLEGECTTMDCDDGDPCTEDHVTCPGTSGCECHHVQVCCAEDEECDDGNPCTEDSCVDEECVHQERFQFCTPCESDDDCEPYAHCIGNMGFFSSYFGNGTCLSSGVCHHNIEGCGYGIDCEDGQCVPQPCDTDADCDDGNGCTADSCEGGECQHLRDIENDFLCRPCEVDEDCDAYSYCLYDDEQGSSIQKFRDAVCQQDGTCQRGALACSFGCNEAGTECIEPLEPECEVDPDCDDGDICTDDFCDDGVCHYEELCLYLDGSPITMECSAAEDCQETGFGDFCLFSEQAGMHVCQECHVSPDGVTQTCPEGMVCLSETSVTDIGPIDQNYCAEVVCESDADCDDGDPCTEDSCVDYGTACESAVIDGCTDQLACQFMGEPPYSDARAIIWFGLNQEEEVELNTGTFVLAVETLCQWGQPAFKFNLTDGANLWGGTSGIEVVCHLGGQQIEVETTVEVGDRVKVEIPSIACFE